MTFKQLTTAMDKFIKAYETLHPFLEEKGSYHLDINDKPVQSNSYTEESWLKYQSDLKEWDRKLAEKEATTRAWESKSQDASRKYKVAGTELLNLLPLTDVIFATEEGAVMKTIHEHSNKIQIDGKKYPPIILDN